MTQMLIWLPRTEDNTDNDSVSCTAQRGPINIRRTCLTLTCRTYTNTQTREDLFTQTCQLPKKKKRMKQILRRCINVLMLSGHMNILCSFQQASKRVVKKNLQTVLPRDLFLHFFIFSSSFASLILFRYTRGPLFCLWQHTIHFLSS